MADKKHTNWADDDDLDSDEADDEFGLDAATSQANTKAPKEKVSNIANENGLRIQNITIFLQKLVRLFDEY